MTVLEKNISALKIICHPVRIKILQYLKQGASCATLTNKAIPISQPNMSQHLNALKKAGLIDLKKMGTKRCYYICRPDFVNSVLGLLEKQLEIINKDDSAIISESMKRAEKMREL